VQGVQAHPQKFCFVENLDKIPENLGKTSENLGKIPEYLGKNGAQRCWTSKNGAQRLHKNTIKTIFLEVTPKTGLHILCGRKFVGKRHTKTFSSSLGKFGQKSFAPPKICLLLHLCAILTGN